MENLWYVSVRFRGFNDGRCDLIGATCRDQMRNIVDLNDCTPETKAAVATALRDFLSKLDP